MRIVHLTVKDEDGYYEGTATVRGYSVTESAPTLQELRDKVIEHLKDENEISEGNYHIEEVSC